MLKVLELVVLVIVTRPPRSPLFRTVAPFFQTKVNGPGPEAVVLKVAVPPSQTAWSAGSVVVLVWTITDAVTVWLSAVTSILAVPEVAPAVNVAEAAPSTKLALTPDRLPNAGVAFTKVAGNAGSPFNSIVKGAPMFLCLISAEIFEDDPVQIVLGVPLARSCRKVVGKTLPDVLRKSFAPGPVLMPHQLSSAANTPVPRKRVSPFVATGTVFPARREYLTLAVVPPPYMAPPKLPAWLAAKELVVTVSGPPLSTIIAPPLAFVAVLLEKLELLMT